MLNHLGEAVLGCLAADILQVVASGLSEAGGELGGVSSCVRHSLAGVLCCSRSEPLWA